MVEATVALRSSFVFWIWKIQTYVIDGGLFGLNHYVIMLFKML